MESNTAESSRVMTSTMMGAIRTDPDQKHIPADALRVAYDGHYLGEHLCREDWEAMDSSQRSEEFVYRQRYLFGDSTLIARDCALAAAKALKGPDGTIIDANGIYRGGMDRYRQVVANGKSRHASEDGLMEAMAERTAVFEKVDALVDIQRDILFSTTFLRDDASLGEGFNRSMGVAIGLITKNDIIDVKKLLLKLSGKPLPSDHVPEWRSMEEIYFAALPNRLRSENRGTKIAEGFYSLNEGSICAELIRRGDRVISYKASDVIEHMRLMQAIRASLAEQDDVEAQRIMDRLVIRKELDGVAIRSSGSSVYAAPSDPHTLAAKKDPSGGPMVFDKAPFAIYEGGKYRSPTMAELRKALLISGSLSPGGKEAWIENMAPVIADYYRKDQEGLRSRLLSNPIARESSERSGVDYKITARFLDAVDARSDRIRRGLEPKKLEILVPDSIDHGLELYRALTVDAVDGMDEGVYDIVSHALVDESSGVLAAEAPKSTDAGGEEKPADYDDSEAEAPDAAAAGLEESDGEGDDGGSVHGIEEQEHGVSEPEGDRTGEELRAPGVREDL